MPKNTKVCSVCGNTYESCKSVRTGRPVFNWREVSCSPECGQVYLEMVMESRNKKSEIIQEEASPLTVEVLEEIDDEIEIDEFIDDDEIDD